MSLLPLFLLSFLLLSLLHCPLARRPAAATVPAPLGERGQGTAEYALLLLAVAAMAAVVIAYLSGDGGGMITDLFGAAFARMRAVVGG